jgi:glucose/arabinose dehydrogenase
MLKTLWQNNVNIRSPGVKKFLLVLLLLLAVAGTLYWLLSDGSLVDPFVADYDEHCSSCHGAKLQGVAELGPALIGAELQHGDSVTALEAVIAGGVAGTTMQGWSAQLSAEEIRGLAIYIAERRVERLFTDFKTGGEVTIPEGVVSSAVHDFRIEVVTDQLDPLPFSLAPLPDGGFLVTEKTKGLRRVSANGEVSGLITGTPAAFDDGFEEVLVWGHGWLLDVALHPDYASNGWIYLHHTERCPDCSLLHKSVNRVVRGRIRDGQWVDEEVIWAPGPDYYSIVPDVGAGGRLAFDDRGYLYISVGVKGSSNFDSVQNLEKPAGKIHRVHDDGRVPADNPFVAVPDAFPSIWTYGHRSPQGLEFNTRTGQIWSTEMGPRGGDELNLLLPGRNYGWPLTSRGLNYDGSSIHYGDWLGIEFDINDIEQPVLDLTPAPAVSSFIFYEGDGFPGWRGHALLGSLKATQLYRVELDGSKVIDYEVLIDRLVRIRDIETGADGMIYLLLEHADGGQIVRLVPAD